MLLEAGLSRCEISRVRRKRSAVIRALAVAAGSTRCCWGPPGTAKSQLARALTCRIDGALDRGFGQSFVTDQTKIIVMRMCAAFIARSENRPHQRRFANANGMQAR